MKIRVNDMVKVIAGKNLGKTGKVVQVFPKRDLVVIEGINQHTKHIRPRSASEKGQSVTFFAPLQISNVMLVCPSCAKPTRVGKQKIESGKSVRVCKKCKQTIRV